MFGVFLSTLKFYFAETSKFKISKGHEGVLCGALAKFMFLEAKEGAGGLDISPGPKTVKIHVSRRAENRTQKGYKQLIHRTPVTLLEWQMAWPLNCHVIVIRQIQLLINTFYLTI